MSTSPSVPDSQNVAPLDDVLSSPTPSPLSAEAVDPVTRLLHAAEGLALLRVRMLPVTRSGAAGPVVSDTEICDECQRQRVLSGMAHAGSCLVGQVLEACAAVRAASAGGEFSAQEQAEAARRLEEVCRPAPMPSAPSPAEETAAEVFYVIERTEGTPTALYMRDRGGSWTHDIHLAAKWNASADAEDVWRRQTSHFRESSAVIEHSWVVAAPIAPAAEDEIDALINEVAPPPLLLELIERRKAPAHDHTWTEREADFFADRNAAWDKLRAAEELIQENERLKAYLNTPETDDFFKGIEAEAAHQRFRWPSENDAGKSPADWFWLVGYLAGKCLYAAIAGDTDKALHHTISTAAALANWHRAIKGVGNMRPGIDTPIEAQPRSSNSERRVVCGRAIAVFGFPGRDVLTCDLEPGHGDGWHHDQAANRMWVADATKIFFHPSGMVETRLFGREPEFDYSAAANAEVAR